METKRTPGPWQYVLNVGPTKALIVEKDGSTIFWASNEIRSSKFATNIQFMTEACNNYERVKAERDELAAALVEVMEWVNNWDVVFKDDPEWPTTEIKVRAALAKLEEQPK